jgi:hypothetical protein
MTTTDTPSVRVDETLARFRDLQAQFERVRDRLRRAEEQKNTVSRRTFDKVRAEYDRELDALRAQLTPLRDQIESHRAAVEGGLEDAHASLEALEEELAEAVFRHKVGEYSDSELAERRAALDARVEAARARIATQRDTLNLFEAMQEPESAPPAPEPRREEPIAPAPSPPPLPRAAMPPHADPPTEAKPEATFSRRPTLSTRNLDAAPAVASAAPVTPKADAPDDLKNDAAFENPHDWIKEMGREAKDSPRAASATDATRPRLETPAPRTPAAAPSSRPAGSRMPSLVFVNGSHAGESIPLLPTTLTIGREHDNNVELKDPDVARYHARIVHERGRYVVEDLDSTTGTWVNGQRTKKAPLNNGDVVRVGSTEIAIDFEWASDPV